MKVTSGYPQVFHVLPHEKAYLADEAIEGYGRKTNT